MKERRLFSRHSIGTRIAALFMLLILVITAVMTYVSISVLTNELLDNATEYTEQLIRRVNAELDMYVEYMKDISDFIVDNGAVAAYLRAANEHRLTDAACRDAQEQLAAAQKIRSEITAIALIPESGGALFGSEGASLNTYSNYQNADWYQAALQEPHEVQVSSSRVENLIAGQYNWVVSFSKAVFDRAGNMQGVLLIDLNYQIIDRLCADIQLGSRGYIYLLDQTGGILWHPQQDLIYAGLKQENVAEVLSAADGRMLSGKGPARRLYVACESEATGWTAVGVAYTQELLRSQDRIYKTYLLIAAAALVLALVFALQLSRSIAEPIRRLMQTMRRVEEGDLHVRSQVSSRTELGQLSDSFDHMIAKTAELMDERLRSEEQKRKSEWKALQAQIQPHFLYNTLDSIIWMSHAGRNEEVVEMTSALALLLRSSIGDGSDTNTLKKEIAHVRSYLTIQKMRYNEKLRYEIDLDPQTEDCLLPKLILQPLVENAIYHGIKVKQQGGTVRIESLLEEDRLLITVEDDGIGMTPEQLETILDKKESDAESTKIGVYNVNERLQLFFGPDAVMKYYSTPGKRTMVMLVLPIVRERRRTAMRKVKLTVFGLMFCLLLHLTGCAAAQKSLRVTLVLKTVTEVAEFWGTLLSGVEKAAEEYGVELEVLTSPREIDIDKQIDLIRQVTEDKPDVMILSAADYDRCAEATEEAIAAGIGVVAIDTDVNAAGRACYVGSNNYQIGLEMGRAMTSYLPDGGKVAVIQHMLTTTTGIERTRGVLDALGEAGNIEIFGSFCCDNSTEQAQTITTELLSADPEIRGFVCTNEVCNVGAANALVDLGLGGKVYVVGCDNSQRQIQFLEQNIIQAIVTQRPFNMGYMAVQQAVRVANGEQTDDFVEVSCVLITRENMYTQENQKLLFPVLR